MSCSLVGRFFSRLTRCIAGIPQQASIVSNGQESSLALISPRTQKRERIVLFVSVSLRKCQMPDDPPPARCLTAVVQIFGYVSPSMAFHVPVATQIKLAIFLDFSCLLDDVFTISPHSISCVRRVLWNFGELLHHRN